MGLVSMKRKVIQIGDSTQLISLPREWAKKFNIKKGNELEVIENKDSLIIKTDNPIDVDKAEFNIEDLGLMTRRCVTALYKKGVDELKINFSDPLNVELVRQAINMETPGFEIIDQKENYCIIRNVSGVKVEEFDNLLRRTFLLLIRMAEESYEAIKKKNFTYLKEIARLENDNNKFTVLCRRLLNKHGHKFNFVGPMYFIIEELENIADQFNYTCERLNEIKGKNVKISNDVLDMYKTANEQLRNFYELFYKFDTQKVVEIKKERQLLIKKAFDLFNKKRNYYDLILLHHSITVMQKVFCLMGPYLIMNL